MPEALEGIGRSGGRPGSRDAERPLLTVVALGGGENLAIGVGRCRRRCAVRVVGDRRNVRRQVAAFGTALANVTGFGHDEVAQALQGADLVLIEALALGQAEVVAAGGSIRLAELAAAERVPVWVVGGVGRQLPPPLFGALVDRLQAGAGSGAGAKRHGGAPSFWTAHADLEHGRTGHEDWGSRSDHEVVPASLVQLVIGPGGAFDDMAAVAADCPVPPELLKAAH